MGDGDEHRFQRVEWDEVGESRRLLTAERAVAALGTLCVSALFVYDRLFAHVYTVGS